MDASVRPELDALPPYEVRCVNIDRIADSDEHRHVIGVETMDPDGGVTRWSLVEAIAAYRDGGRFIVGSGEGGRTAELGPAVCPRCRMATLSLDPADASVDLPHCS